MALEKEIWQKDIVDHLWKENGFLSTVTAEDEYVLAGKVVHIPQAGAPSNVEKNRATVPATPAQRTDSEVLYALNEFTTDPRLIRDAEKVELSYNKRDSIIGDDKQKIAEEVAEDLIDVWARGLNTDHIITEAAIARASLQKMQTMFNVHNVPQQDRYALVPASIIPVLFPDTEVTALLAMMRSNDERLNSMFDNLYGFKIQMRSSALTFDAGGALKPPGSAGAADDTEGILCYQKRSLAKAVGEVKMFDNPAQAAYYGDLVSFLLRAGGRRRREDDKGVGILKV
ncbi:hypothetical protein [Persicobacter sp. CCB-QB2]|uniref:hypothetical protein n=1 Tax=Persicobacter sp. CCB-QB2 TaxID=1561025 RepID=UPI0006A9A0D6|nr:hypothetical protein [Persicobacter sp. CCB-QB2]